MPSTSPGGGSSLVASHFLLLVVFAAFVSLVFAMLMRDEPREQARYGGLLFVTFVLAAMVFSWLMYPFPL